MQPFTITGCPTLRCPSMKLSRIAEALGARIEGGSPDADITGVAGIEHARPGHITFVSKPKKNVAARTTQASAVNVPEDSPPIPAATLRTKNPYLAWAKAVALFYQ